ncbi:MAG: hypothetical protein HWQ38_00595 [Nostoc sp. NMS7]|uniref:hypothetical protein n=1 Tax=Nostoc sp. NMS7 TaxID=2815391 RepID=UPI0025F666A9|nr:hypothetical protein [Nostoc sp. NMS7]MBN3945060.1 hypothetical protein [Nostoc sp. NMS7]
MATFTVTNTNNSGAGSLRQEILDANALTGKNIINFSGLFNDGLAHTISLTSSGLSITDNLTIQGTNPNLLTVKDDSATRVFDIASGVTAAINGLTITNSYKGTGGGGAISNEGVFTLNNSIITGNTAEALGGGIFNNGTLTVNYSTLTNNTAESSDYNFFANSEGGGVPPIYYGGGGIYNNGTLTVNYSTISNNKAGTNPDNSGGNLYFSGGGIDNSGGGIDGSYSLSPRLVVNNSIITGNTALYDGGGIANDSILTLNDSKMIGNSARVGGGIFNASNAVVVDEFDEGQGVISTISHSTISGNQAHFGGGIYNDGALTVGNSTIKQNRAFGIEFITGQKESGEGGGIYNNSTKYASATLDYSTVASNFDTPQEDSTKFIKLHNLVGKFINIGSLVRV